VVVAARLIAGARPQLEVPSVFVRLGRADQGTTTPAQDFLSQNGREAMESGYPRPPYPAQQQPMPDDTASIDPIPDHGETTYKGSSRLAGERAGQPAELATTYVMLVDPLSSYVSGATVAVTGGRPFP
jgi:NAD(P)-dependent dehydrogenase (short-subunit alcohol dehydrogenase family)